MWTTLQLLLRIADDDVLTQVVVTWKSVTLGARTPVLTSYGFWQVLEGRIVHFFLKCLVSVRLNSKNTGMPIDRHFVPKVGPRESHRVAVECILAMSRLLVCFV